MGRQMWMSHLFGQDGSLLRFCSKPMRLSLLWSALHIVMHCKVWFLENLFTFVLPRHCFWNLLFFNIQLFGWYCEWRYHHCYMKKMTYRNVTKNYCYSNILYVYRIRCLSERHICD